MVPGDTTPDPTLLFRGGALGDFVLALPVLAELGRGGRRPWLCATPGHAALAVAGGLVERTFRLDDPRWDPLWAGGDLAAARMLLQGVGRVVVLRPVHAGAVTERLRACGVREVVVHDPRPPAGKRVHVADHLLRGVVPGAAPAVPRLELKAAPIETGPTVLLMPGAGGERKRWPMPWFQRLAELLRVEGFRPLWVTGPVEAERLAGQLDGLQPRVHDADPVETARLCAGAAVVVGNDTGTSHQAPALDRRFVCNNGRCGWCGRGHAGGRPVRTQGPGPVVAAGAGARARAAQRTPPGGRGLR